MRKSIWLNPPLERLVAQCGTAKGRDGKFSRRLGEIVERYDTIMKLIPVPDITDTEKMIIGKIICGSVITPLTIRRMDESVMDCATGTAAERQALAEKISSWSVTERLAIIESLGI